MAHVRTIDLESKAFVLADDAVPEDWFATELFNI